MPLCGPGRIACFLFNANHVLFMTEILSIYSTSYDDVRRKIYMANIKSVFFAHGLLPGISSSVLKSIVDEFGRAAGKFPDEKTALMLAVNSNASLNLLRTLGRFADDMQGRAYESAQKILPVLKEKYPGRRIVTVEFNDPEPDPLYSHLKISGGSVQVPYGFTVRNGRIAELKPSGLYT